MHRKNKISERRKYLRLNTIFLVELQFVDEERNPISDTFQGFTTNVGKGGMCIELKAEKDKDKIGIISAKARLRLVINIPQSIPTESYAVIKWSEKVPELMFNTYRFGVEYDEIESDNQKMIERYVLWQSRKPKILLAIFIIILTVIILLMRIGIKPA